MDRGHAALTEQTAQLVAAVSEGATPARIGLLAVVRAGRGHLVPPRRTALHPMLVMPVRIPSAKSAVVHGHVKLLHRSVTCGGALRYRGPFRPLEPAHDRVRAARASGRGSHGPARRR
ncbi:hypothetical protein GCM10010406_09660 [Streptomyces thermolineatus]|uniref:Uncharacterized protein n=1 Tax=Streptomyces thermolineatus TaxID=44033 RepID=A0ABN3L3Z1_9ACTN